MDSNIVKYCAPTLAGIKTGSLFRGNFRDGSEMLASFRRWNGIFRENGLRAVPFENKRGDILVYIYRASQLMRDLNLPEARDILTRRGYSPEFPEKCVKRLSKRICEDCEFPHEIGLFLGYPPEDVRGFIEKSDCRFSGAWKVYGDVGSAKKQFSQLKKCTEIYSRLYEKSRSIERLCVLR